MTKANGRTMLMSATGAGWAVVLFMHNDPRETMAYEVHHTLPGHVRLSNQHMATITGFQRFALKIEAKAYFDAVIAEVVERRRMELAGTGGAFSLEITVNVPTPPESGEQAA